MFQGRKDKMLLDLQVHNHDGDNLIPLKENFIEELKRLSATTFEDLRSIYDNVLQNEE